MNGPSSCRAWIAPVWQGGKQATGYGISSRAVLVSSVAREQTPFRRNAGGSLCVVSRCDGRSPLTLWEDSTAFRTPQRPWLVYDVTGAIELRGDSRVWSARTWWHVIWGSGT